MMIFIWPWCARTHTHTHTPLWEATSPCPSAPVSPLAGEWSSRRRPAASSARGPPRWRETTGLCSAAFPEASWWTRPFWREKSVLTIRAELRRLLDFGQSVGLCEVIVVYHQYWEDTQTYFNIHYQPKCLNFTWRLKCASECRSSAPSLPRSSSGGRAPWPAAHIRCGDAGSSPLSFPAGRWPGIRGGPSRSNRTGTAGWDRAGFGAHLARPGWCTGDAGRDRQGSLLHSKCQKWMEACVMWPTKHYAKTSQGTTVL